MEVALFRSATSPVSGLTDQLFDEVGPGADGNMDGEAVDALLDAARARVAAGLQSEVGAWLGWEIRGGMLYSIDGGIWPAVPLSLRAAGRLGAFDDIRAVRAWVGETFQLAATTFARVEGELADMFGCASAR